MDEPTDEWMTQYEDREASKKNKGIYTNRVFAQPLGEGLLRVNFGEVLDDEPSYHTAIVISASNAVLFAQLIYQMGTAILEAAQAPVEAKRASGDI